MNLSRPLTRALVRALAGILGAAVALTPLVVTTPPAAGSTVDDYADYDGQRTCARVVLPGTEYLLRYLVRTRPGTRGVSLLRACTEGTSEHKDGRALDWGVDVLVPREKAMAERWIAQVLAPDARGNQHALARRMGIMYIIWNDHIWSSYRNFEASPYRPCDRLADCSKTLRHRDHVHVSLSRSGAAAQTTFYRARKVPSVPVLVPGTRRLDPVGTAVVSFDVPASGRTVVSDFRLVSGTTYRLVADGLYRAGPGTAIADAACRWSAGAWVAGTSLLVNGTDPWPDACAGSHTHSTTFTATATDFLRLRVSDATYGDNEGALRVAIVREDLPASTVAQRRVVSGAGPRPALRNGPVARLLTTERVAVPASSSRGVLTARALRRNTRYRVVVTGTARSGSTSFDGACARYARGWRAQHTLDLTRPDADHLSLFVNGVRVVLRAPASSSGCDAGGHRYVGVIPAAMGGRARLRVWDPYSYADNAGALTVVVRRA